MASKVNGVVILAVVTAMAMGSTQGVAQPTMEINIPLDDKGWQAQPEQVRPAELPRMMKVYDGPEARVSPAAPYSVSAGAFSIADGRTASLRTMIWTRPLPQADLSRCHYFLLTYRTVGLARSYAPLNAVAIVGQGADGKEMTVPLLPVAEVLNDNLWHTVVGKATFPAGGTLRVQVGTKDGNCPLYLRTLKLMEQPSVLGAVGSPTPPMPAKVKWECLDLARQFNDTCAAVFERMLARQGVVIDGVNALDGQAIAGIPFKTGDAKANLIRPPETKADEEPIEFLGVKTTRHFVRPPGRDDVVAVDIGKKAREVLFLMISEVPKGGSRYAIAPGPQNFSDIGALSVELRYDTGEPDIAFPYSLADRGFTATRMAGLYAVAADPKRMLRRLILHNHVIGNNHSLAAVTLNVGEGPLVPELVAEPPPIRVRKLAAPKPQQPYLRQEGQLLKLGNSACDMVLDCSAGLAITKLVSRRGNTDMLGGGIGTLEVRCGDVLLRGRAFRTKSVKAEGNRAVVTLDSMAPEVPLSLEITIAVDDRPEVRFNLSARNTGDKEIAPEVRFPLLEGVSIGRAEDTWMFFPQYRNVLSKDYGSYLVGNDRSFPMQFMDIFNPGAGVGLGLLTRNTNLAPLDYGIGKDGTGVTAFVQSPEAFSKLQPGQSLSLPETVLLPHAGDWHVTMAAYKQWLSRVGADVPSQTLSAVEGDAPERDWFQRLFAMRVHLTKKAYSWAIPIYDPDTKQYRIDEFMKADTDYLGLPPQIVHLGGWCDYDQEQGGDFLGGDYAVKDYTGGADNLRAAVRKLQDEGHIPVSLYMIPDRCRKTSEIGQRLGRKACTVRADGWVGEDGPVYYVCPAYAPWQDHYVEAVQRTQRETGVKAIYVDVFGLSNGTACYSQEHGHPVPSNPRQVNRDLIRRIREALPPEVAVWTEFPLDDMNARYVDGNIHYYCLDWHEYFSETYDAPESAPRVAATAQNAYRYVFPSLRQFIFLCGSNGWSSESKFPFFNGEPLYDVSWFLYHGPHLDRMRQSLALQTKYAECFASPQPIMEAPTERWEVHANEFPGEGRTAWTLYNARYTTGSGPVLKVPHVAGATYYDAWRDRPLKAVIRGKTATISLRLEPQSLGCIVQERRP